jgi:hypothetical protein
MRALVLLSSLCVAVSPACAQLATEAGVAITDPAVVQELEVKGYTIGAILFPNAPPVKNDNLFKGPLKSVATALTRDISLLPTRSPDNVARGTFKTTASHLDFRMSAGLVNDAKSGFVLTGIVNRMDRAYRSLSPVKKLVNCGEIRFLYRFTYDITVADANDPTKTNNVASRLPFTLAVVFNAKGENDPITCADIAQRWQKLRTLSSAADILAYLMSDGGPLKYLQSSQIDRIETNLQMFRLPASVKPDFGGHAEYLLRVFRRDAAGKPFVVTGLENQLDRDKLLADPKKLKEFKKWILDPKRLDALDQGIIEFPFKNLATKAISVSPGGSARSQNQPSFRLFTDGEVAAALAKYVAKTGKPLEKIKSVAGFNRRIDDMTCNGCHQTRAIAGFHFAGADPASEAPSNAVHIPGSAHFNADLPRRQAVIDAFAAKQRPDFSRPFNARPDAKFRNALAGTQLFNGWGSICQKGTDPSFVTWTCAEKLECQALHASSHEPGMGVCVTEGATKIGDPVEFGKVIHHAFGNDTYDRTTPSTPAEPDNYVVPAPPNDRSDYKVAHQGFRKKDSTGGFPAGMLRIKGCTDLPGEARCGRVAATGFNACIGAGKPFPECLKLTETAGLRACDRSNPCRADYICTAPYALPGPNQAMGTCIPPYFMFQFRVDGHPEAPTENEPAPNEPENALLDGGPVIH